MTMHFTHIQMYLYIHTHDRHITIHFTNSCMCIQTHDLDPHREEGWGHITIHFAHIHLYLVQTHDRYITIHLTHIQLYLYTDIFHSHTAVTLTLNPNPKPDTQPGSSSRRRVRAVLSSSRRFWICLSCLTICLSCLTICSSFRAFDFLSSSKLKSFWYPSPFSFFFSASILDLRTVCRVTL